MKYFWLSLSIILSLIVNPINSITKNDQLIIFNRTDKVIEVSVPTSTEDYEAGAWMSGGRLSVVIQPFNQGIIIIQSDEADRGQLFISTLDSENRWWHVRTELNITNISVKHLDINYQNNNWLINLSNSN